AGFVESVYGWKETAFPVTEEEKEQLNAALGELAKASLEAETSRFRLTHRLVCEHLGKPKAKGSLFPLALKLGWLNEVGVAEENPREKVYGFYHATFQEYLAALAVEDWDYFLPRNHVDCPVEGKRYRIFEKQWKQVILLWLGREDVKDEEKEGFIRALVEFDDGFAELKHHSRDFYEYQAYFIAAAAINEFKVCSLVTEVVRQVVKWGFGYFNIEKQEWRIFLEPIGEVARESISETIRRQAISELIAILEHCPDHETCRRAAENLGEIDLGNARATEVLIQLLETIDSEGFHGKVAESLGKIGQGNRRAVEALVRYLETTNDEFSPIAAVNSLLQIGQGSVIADLVRILTTTESDDTRWNIVSGLGKQVNAGNPIVIAALLQVIKTPPDILSTHLAPIGLGEIAQGNLEAITALIHIVKTHEDETLRENAVKSLGKIAQGNSEAIRTLIHILYTNSDGSLRRTATESLGKIAQGNSEAIKTLVHILISTQDYYTRRSAAKSLGKAEYDSLEDIAMLIHILKTTKNEDDRRKAAKSLGEIAEGNSEAIMALVHTLETPQDYYTRSNAAESLAKIGQGNPDAIAALVKLIKTTEDENTRKWTAQSLGKILTTSQHYAGVVSALKHNLSDEVYQNNFKRFKESYKVIWNCAENLPYPEFYQAWHCPPTTPHPEVTEQTPHSGEPSFASPLTWESLQHLPLYCLNADLLADETREREIALTLSELIWEITCPDEDPPEPATPAELRRHLKTLQRRNLEPHRAILFGSETVSTPTQPTPALIAFCQKLTGVIAIAFLTDDPLEAPLKGFPPNQPNLISAIETWLGESVHRGSP
ncbi:HEAT repeat domain-containing protein, partial [Arthrospira platensis SPKY2]